MTISADSLKPKNDCVKAQDDPQLLELRDAIDAIDNQLLDLLEQRLQVVEKVGQLKQSQGVGGCFVRPAREANMLRAILQRLGGQYPVDMLVSVWRKIITASTLHEKPFSIAASFGHHSGLEAILKDYYLVAADIQDMQGESDLIAALSLGNADIAAFAVESRREVPWWVDIPKEAGYAFACLPFLSKSEDNPASDYLLVGKVQPEPSGDDYTLVYLNSDQPCLEFLPSDVTVLDHRGSKDALLLLEGFVPEDQLVDKLECAESTWQWLGAFAKPIQSSL